MPTDPSTAPANATTRRSFLLLSAAGGAIVSAVALPLAAWSPSAGAAPAQVATGMDDVTFAGFTAPLELAATLAYQAAIDTELLDTDWTTGALEFQRHHQDVVVALTALLPTTAPPPVAAEAFSKPIATKVSAAVDQKAILGLLGDMEDVLSATHLMAIESIDDPVTASVAAQVLAAGAQRATALLLVSGADVKAITPEEANTDGALSPGDVAGAPPAGEKSGTGSGGGSGGSNSSGSSANKGNTGGKNDKPGGSSGTKDNSGGGTGDGTGSGSGTGSGNGSSSGN